MIERLDQLTLQQLIELSCGDKSVLVVGDEKPDEKALSKRAAAIMAEYKAIASPVQSKIDLNEKEKLSKLGIKSRCASICLYLCSQGRSDLAKEVLIELNVDESCLATDEDIIKHCQSILGEVGFEIERITERKVKGKDKAVRSPESTRKSWYSEIASVMSVFRMSIDLNINAAIYANLVRQAVERNKALAKLPRSARLFM